MRLQAVTVALLVGCSASSSSVRSEAPAAPPPPAAAAAAAAVAPPAGPVAPAPAGLPLARTVEVTETRFGVTVSDPYRWMEGNDNPELTAWLRTQGDWTGGYLSRIPGRQALLARVRELGNATGSIARVQRVGDKLYYFETAPGEQVAKIMVSERGKARLVVAPAAFESGGGHVSIGSFAVSPDGRKLAFNVDRGGGETAAIHVLDLATGKELADRVERVPGGLAPTWLADGTGFFYTQKAAEGPGVDPMLNPQLRLHVLGTAADRDPVQLGSSRSDVPVAPNEWAEVTQTRSPRWVLVSMAGARSEERLIIAPAAIARGGKGHTLWQRVADYEDGVAEAAIHGDRVYLLAYKGASNFRIVSVSAAHPDPASARVEIPEDPGATLVAITAARDALYVVKSANGLARLLRWAWAGQPTEIALPFEGWIDKLVAAPMVTAS